MEYAQLDTKNIAKISQNSVQKHTLPADQKDAATRRVRSHGSFCNGRTEAHFLLHHFPQLSFNPTARLNTGLPALWSTPSATK